MSIDIRLSPSGPVLATLAAGAVLRLTEAASTLTGNTSIPTIPDVICPDGFGNTDAIVLTLPSPKEGLSYRANLSLDIVNNSTDVQGAVALYLDVSVDGGTVYQNIYKNGHLIEPIHPSLSGDFIGRQIQLWFPLTTGAALGVVDATPTPSIKLRARAAQCTLAGVEVSSDPSITGSELTVNGLNGTFHMQLEECLTS